MSGQLLTEMSLTIIALKSPKQLTKLAPGDQDD